MTATLTRITGDRHDNLLRSIAAGHGRRIGSEDFGSVYVMDGKVWLVDADTATPLGDYWEYLMDVRDGKRPGAVIPDLQASPDTIYVTKTGDAVPEGHCIMPDHYETTYTVTVRSMMPLSPERLRNVIQDRYEVTDCVMNVRKCVVR